MIVCICNNISDRQINKAIAEGMLNLEVLKRELGVSTTCGSCAEFIRQMLHTAQLEKFNQKSIETASNMSNP